MACVFPTFVTSEYTIDEEFLVPLKMERYADVFHGLSVDELRELTDERLQSMGVMIKGHRSRLLKAAQGRSRSLKASQGCSKGSSWFR